MNPEVKTLWTTALRGGDYQQGKDSLCQDNGFGKRFCPMGVLCDISKLGSWTTDEGDTHHEEDLYYLVEPEGAEPSICAYFPTEKVLSWAGLANESSAVPYKGDAVTLSDLSDEYGLSFSEIADLIEEHL